MSWTLFGLCQNLEAQRKLREELLALSTDDPTMDQLKALPYLDMVVRESLRLYSPVFVTRRVAVRDTVLPMKDGPSIRYVPPQTVPIFPSPRSDLSIPVHEQYERRGQVYDPDLRDEH